jgi:hypothetical protein
MIAALIGAAIGFYVTVICVMLGVIVAAKVIEFLMRIGYWLDDMRTHIREAIDTDATAHTKRGEFKKGQLR